MTLLRHSLVLLPSFFPFPLSPVFIAGLNLNVIKVIFFVFEVGAAFSVFMSPRPMKLAPINTFHAVFPYILV